MDRPPPHQLNPSADVRRRDALAVAAAGVEAVAPQHLMPRVAAGLTTAFPRITSWSVLAAGKAAAGMFAAFAADAGALVGPRLVIGPVRPPEWPLDVPFVEGGHPFATPASLDGAERALALAAAVPPDGGLVCLLSGGASALMAAPMVGLTLETKQRTAAQVMAAGGDITTLNAVRKHLSRVKGGRLAAACAGIVRTYAISDVIGDDLSVIGSGPCVPDASTWDDAADALRRIGAWDGLDATVRAAFDAGLAGTLPDTPKADDPRLARAAAEVIGGRRQAMDGAAAAAAACGYTPLVVEAPVTGEARDAAVSWWSRVVDALATQRGPLAIVSSGETTVRVHGGGRGGRNQEFALALVDALAGHARRPVLVSIGTDGIDGPTDAAGAVVDAATADRAVAAGVSPSASLAANDSYAFFAPLGQLVRTGPTGTNVGDLQVFLAGPA